MPLAAAALEPLLRLAMVPGVGPARISWLLKHFGSAERVLGATAADVQKLPGFGPAMAARVAEAGAEEGAARAREGVKALERVGAVAITPGDLAYPECFRAIPDPPYLVFAIGDLSLLGRPAVGVVGTRNPTEYGVRTTRDLVHELTDAGYVIVSGMARGIDAAAHAAALDAEGGTVGVLGHGIDRVYPAENRALFRRVREEGLLITELAPGEEPLSGNFPRRNRLIAALSEGVLVVEMGEKSGAQHTVTYALEQGKEVFAVPGPVGSPTSAGTNQLLKDGARLVTSARDVLEELRGVGPPETQRRTFPVDGEPARRAAGAPVPARGRTAAPPGLAPEEARVYDALESRDLHVDDLAEKTELAPSTVLAALLGLELRGLAEPLPGKRFRRR